jgi:hypothetical protein
MLAHFFCFKSEEFKPVGSAQFIMAKIAEINLHVNNASCFSLLQHNNE